MSDITLLTSLKLAELRNKIRLLRHQPVLKIIVLTTFSIAFWTTLYKVFLYLFKFLGTFSADTNNLIATIFYIFFFSLTIMLVISNGIISYTSLFRAKETAFLLTSPIRVESVFVYRLIESLVFSSWALLFLATPLMAAYMAFYKLSWHFLVLSIILFGAFTLIPSIIGSTAAMIITTFLPRTKRGVFITIIGIAIGGALVFLSKLLTLRGTLTTEYLLVKEIFDTVGFARNPIFPSYWVCRGIFSLSTGEYTDALFFFLLILSNITFLGMLAYLLAKKFILRGWFVSQGLSHRRIISSHHIFDTLLNVCLFYIRKETRNIVIKDIKSFIRDPAQWSQFLIFFGLLALYFLNLRTFAYDEKQLYWKVMVAQMNLIATSLTLATFTSRFIFPQFSLEGRRFWIIGMAPINRSNILFSKLTLSVVSSFIISELLIGISSYMLRVPTALFVLHIFTLLAICLGLSGLSVGLGTIYPNFREDNPSKIISGFGGTLNLVLSLAFVLAIILLQHLLCYVMFRYPARFAFTHLWSITAVLGITAITVLALFIPMWFGLKAIKNIEV